MLGIEGGTVSFDVPKHGAIAVPFEAIAQAKLILTDALIKATAPISSDGADKVLEER